MRDAWLQILQLAPGGCAVHGRAGRRKRGASDGKAETQTGHAVEWGGQNSWTNRIEKVMSTQVLGHLGTSWDILGHLGTWVSLPQITLKNFRFASLTSCFTYPSLFTCLTQASIRKDRLCSVNFHGVMNSQVSCKSLRHGWWHTVHRWSKNVSLACLQRLEVLQGLQSLLAPEPCNRTMVVSWWKTKKPVGDSSWGSPSPKKVSLQRITIAGFAVDDGSPTNIQPQEDAVLRQWIDIEMTKWQEMERSCILVKQPKQAWESSRHDAQIFLIFSKSRYAISQQRGMRSFKKPNVECNPCSSQNVSNITSFKYHDSQHQTYSPMVHRLPSFHPVYLKHLKPFTTLHYPSLPFTTPQLYPSSLSPCFWGLATSVGTATLRIPADILGGSSRFQGLGQEAAGDSPGRKWSYSPSRDWTCCVSASKIIKIMVNREFVTMSPLAVDFGDHFPIPTGTPMVLESCCCRACDLFKTHWSCRAAWGGLEGSTRLGGCGLICLVTNSTMSNNEHIRTDPIPPSATSEESWATSDLTLSSGYVFHTSSWCSALNHPKSEKDDPNWPAWHSSCHLSGHWMACQDAMPPGGSWCAERSRPRNPKMSTWRRRTSRIWSPI